MPCILVRNEIEIDKIPLIHNNYYDKCVQYVRNIFLSMPVICNSILKVDIDISSFELLFVFFNELRVNRTQSKLDFF